MSFFSHLFAVPPWPDPAPASAATPKHTPNSSAPPWEQAVARAEACLSWEGMRGCRASDHPVRAASLASGDVTRSQNKLPLRQAATPCPRGTTAIWTGFTQVPGRGRRTAPARHPLALCSSAEQEPSSGSAALSTPVEA